MKCRLCNNEIMKPFLSLGNSPLANSYIKEDDLYKKEEYYPLDIYVCEKCKLVQSMDYVPSELIFNPEYAYFSSFSKTWIEHCKNYVSMIVGRLGLNENSRIVEIGSNDGVLLEFFKKCGINDVLGVDPARDAAHEAAKKGVDTDICMFNDHYVKSMMSYNSVDLIIGNNVLAHNSIPNEFVKSMKYVLRDNGVITVEFPHLLNLIEDSQFDTIYHEHYSYFSLITAEKLFKQNGLCVYDVEEIPTHGGSLRLYVKHSEDCSKDVLGTVRKMIEREEEFGLNDISTYYNFASVVAKIKKNILLFMIELLRLLELLKSNNVKDMKKGVKRRKRKVICYGAAAKGNTLLNYCGIGKDFIDYVVDMNPHKQGKYLPGTHIPVYSPDKIKEDKPDYIIVLPWNFKDEIIKQLEYTKEWNCKLMTLIPGVEIVNL